MSPMLPSFTMRTRIAVGSGTAEITELHLGFGNFLSAFIFRQHPFEHGLIIREVLFGEHAAPQKFSDKSVVNTADRQGRERQVLAFDDRRLERKPLAVVELESLRGKPPHASSVQIYRTKIRKSLRRLADYPEGSVGVEPALGKDRNTDNQEGACEDDRFKCLAQRFSPRRARIAD